MRRYSLLKACIMVLVILLAVMISDGRGGESPPAQVYLTLTGRVAGLEEKISYGGSPQIIVTLSDPQFAGSNPEYEQFNIEGKKVLAELKTGEVRPKIGSFVFIRGVGGCFEHASNPGQFDAALYYESLGYALKIKEAEVTGSTADYNPVLDTALVIRGHLGSGLNAVSGEHENGILKAILLGSKSELDRDIKNVYSDAGIGHILAISGLHISFIGMGLYELLKRMLPSRKLAGLISVTVLYLYVFICGSAVSALRAYIMFVMMMLAELLGRSYERKTALGIAAVALSFNRVGILQNSGFQLSFCAIFGIEVIYPVLKEQITPFNHNPVRKLACEAFIAGFSVNLATLPILLRTFCQFSPYSLIINIYVIALMPAVLTSGMAAMLLGSLGVWLGGLPGACLVTIGRIAVIPAQLLFATYSHISEFTTGLPFGVIVCGCPTLMQSLIYYVLLLGFIFCLRAYYLRHGAYEGEKRRIMAGLVKAAVSVFIMSVMFVSLRNPYEITFVDVGQGDGTVMGCGYRKAVLLDGGSSSEKNLYKNVYKPLLLYKGIRTVEAAIITHPDSDHYSAIEELLSDEERKVRIKSLILPPAYSVQGDEEGREVLARLERLATQAGCRVFTMEKGDSINFSGLRLECIYPVSGIEAADSNAGCIVLKVHSGRLSVLFMADMDGEGERALLKESGAFIGHTDILKVAHHGSKASSSEELLRKVRPKLSVISVGKNSYGHPDMHTTDRLKACSERVLRTDYSGAVTVSEKGNRLEVITFK